MPKKGLVLKFEDLSRRCSSVDMGVFDRPSGTLALSCHVQLSSLGADWAQGVVGCPVTQRAERK